MPEKEEQQNEEKKENEKHKKIRKKLNGFLVDYFYLLVFGLVVFILILGLVFLLKPKYEKIISNVEVDKTEKQAQLHKQEQRLAKINHLIDLYQKVDPEKKQKVEKILSNPDNYYYEKLFNEMERIANSNNILIESISIAPEEEKEVTSRRKSRNSDEEKSVTLNDFSSQIKKTEIEVSVVNASYAQFKNFLESVEKNLKLMDVVNINFLPASKTGQFMIYTYHYKDN